jgi:hypothetical protein
MAIVNLVFTGQYSEIITIFVKWGNIFGVLYKSEIDETLNNV